MDAELRRLYDENLSCSQIAAKMQRGLSRNAIIGRAHRLGLSGKVYVRRQREPRTKPANKKIVRLAWANGHSDKLRVFETIEAEFQPRCIELEPRHISLLDLTSDDCRYPYGEGPYTFCGHPKRNGSPYCVQHSLLIVAKPRERLTQEQLLQNRRDYMKAYRAEKRASMEAAE